MEKPLDQLSERERQILALVAQGASNKEIASQLNISTNTVKVHLRNIFAKLGVRSRTGAMAAALAAGILDTVPTGAQMAGSPAESAGQMVAEVPVSQKLALLLGLIVLAALWLWPEGTPVAVRAVAADPFFEPGGISAYTQPSQQVGRWEQVGRLPQPRARMGAALWGRELFVIGGGGPGAAENSVQVVNVEDGVARTASPLPFPVSNVVAVALAGQIYVAGGMTQDGSVTDRLAVYDIAADSWGEGPRLPEPLCAYGAAASDGRLFVCGGWNGQSYVRACYALDAAAGRWERLSPLPSGRGHLAVTVAGGNLWAIGGFDGRRVLRESLWLPIGAASEGAWQRGPDLRVPRAGAAAAAISEAIYVLGGGWDRPVETGEKLEPGGQSWSPWPAPLAGQWRNLALVSDGSALYAVGGWAGGYLDAIYRYQALYTLVLPQIAGP
jgi:DNA-binding CsgD family transcriptional regulator/N-acetylneuraminic acid mutarotase